MNSKPIRKPVRKKVAKVPVIIQLEALECGAAALDMVLAYYGKWIPLEIVRRDCGVSRDGSKAKNILLAARNYGLTADAYRLEAESIAEEADFPCIIHWNMNHFVVLCGFRGDKAVINDPARGTCEVSGEEFSKSFTGICLCFAPGENFVPSGKPGSIFAFAKKKLYGSRSAFVLVTAATIITSLIGIITPGFTNVFADRLLTGRNPDWIYPFMAGISLIALLQIVVAWINAVYSLKSNGKIAITSNAEYMWHTLRLPMEFFSQRMAGDIIMRKALNATIASTLIETFSPLVIQASMLLFYLFIMMRYNPILSLAGITAILINVLISRYISAKRVDLSRVIARDRGKLESSTIAGVEMIESIKSTGAENGYFKKWSGYQAAANAGEDRFVKTDTFLGLIPSLSMSLTNTFVFAASVYLCMRGEWTVGMIAAFAGFLNAFLAPAQQLISASQILQEMRTSMEQVEDVLEYPVDPRCDAQNTVPVQGYDKLHGKVELKNVTFGYSRLAEPLIRDFSLTILPGQTVAVVGATGCGKSTISKLISGLYQPWSGEILFDGVPLQKINRSIFTNSVSVVDQDIILFEDTIENNIKMWDQSIENFEMILAARDAQIHEMILSKSGGYQHRLSENGKDLSGGERQRLEIARVLAQEPTILIMDEATSALDAKTECDVVNAIRDRGITCIVIAHRLSTVRTCDQILVMENGQAAEQGTHEELYKMGGLYNQLVSS